MRGYPGHTCHSTLGTLGASEHLQHFWCYLRRDQFSLEEEVWKLSSPKDAWVREWPRQDSSLLLYDWPRDASVSKESPPHLHCRDLQSPQTVLVLLTTFCPPSILFFIPNPVQKDRYTALLSCTPLLLQKSWRQVKVMGRTKLHHPLKLHLHRVKQQLPCPRLSYLTTIC